MRRGDIEIEGRIDLHGMKHDAARAAVVAFITRAVLAGKRCLLIITGKGKIREVGVLRSSLPRWLDEPELRPRILVLRQAQPKHGGDGAWYVLLRKSDH